MTKKIVLLVAGSGYQHIEYNETKRVLADAGLLVTTASDTAGRAVGKDLSTTPVDITLPQIQPEDYDALYIIGGPGALEHLDTEESYTLLRHWQASGKPYGAICIAPRILARAGVLQGKKATGWNKDGELGALFLSHGVTYVPEGVVADGNVITAEGPAAAVAFGQAILRCIQQYHS